MERDMLKNGVGFHEQCTPRNQHRAIIDLTGTNQGANLTLAVEEVKIALQGVEAALEGK
jgi:hypothetical protein